MRARQVFYNWMNERCGLVNKSNPCRCAKKTRAYIQGGYVDPGNLKFNSRYKKKIYELSKEKAVAISNTVEDLYKNIFQQHPFQEPLSGFVRNFRGNDNIFSEFHAVLFLAEYFFLSNLK
jgi:hypothetical protein